MLNFSKHENDRLYTALHESGHAVCARLLGFNVARISIRKEEGADGRCDYDTSDSLHNDTILMGGLTACVLYDEIHGTLPFGVLEYHENGAREDIMSTRGPVEAAYKRARKLLLYGNYDALERVTMAVLRSRFGVIVGSEVDRAMRKKS